MDMDFDRIGAEFDKFLPQIQPVALALLERLGPVGAGDLVLDIACGSGEPGLTLARRAPAVQVLGVDRAEAMLAVARRKAERGGLSNARFENMGAEALTVADRGVDHVVSRFGALMFGDVPATARELARVLRPGGSFSLAVWDDSARNTMMNGCFTLMRDHLPAARLAALEALNQWAGEERRVRLLEEAGLRAVRTELFAWTYDFERFEDAWELVAGMGKLTGLADLSAALQNQIRRGLEASLSAYRDPTGRYLIPHACRLLYGRGAAL